MRWEMREDPFIRETTRKTLDMAGQPIEFPILYYDTRWMNAIFTVSTSRQKNTPTSQFQAN